jgi:alkyl sulfatase BDS1-like metallo-beta-lactamase superfamily hydrolase
MKTGGIMADTAKEFFDGLQDTIDADKIKGIDATYQWDIAEAGKWYAKLSDGTVEVSEGEAESSDITISCSESDWLDIVSGKLNGQMAFLTGKLKIQGDMSLAMKLQSLTG